MKKNENKSADVNGSNDKIHISKSIFETNRELQKKADEQEKKRQEELEKKLAQRKKKADEEREKRLEAERLELIRLKQGVIEESEIIRENSDEKKPMTFWQKIGNFFYLNKWWLGLAVLFGAIGIFLIQNLLTRPNPDITVLVIGENYAIGEESQLDEYVESFTTDTNGNGKIEASIYYIPYSGDERRDYANSVLTKLSAILQSDDGAIVIGNELAAESLKEDGVLMDLSQLYPENKLVKNNKLMLENSKFAEKIGIDKSRISEDWFIAIRNPRKLMHTSEKDMQELYDKDFPVFDAIVKDISE